jgi:hypothetical protein
MARQEETLERRTSRREPASGQTRSGRPSGRIVAQPPLRQCLHHIVGQWRVELQRLP